MNTPAKATPTSDEIRSAMQDAWDEHFVNSDAPFLLFGNDGARLLYDASLRLAAKAAPMREDVTPLIEQVRGILIGIDCTQAEDGGWWETSTGEAFGAARLAEVEAAILAHTARPDARPDTVEFVRDWLMSSDHPTSDWERQFAAAIDARAARPDAGDDKAEIERLRGLLIDPGSPPWEDARAVLVAELRKEKYLLAAMDAEEGEPCMVPSRIALNLIAQATKAGYKEAWVAYNDELKWMQDNRKLAAYLGWNLAAIANDLIDRAYPGLRDKPPT